MFELVTSTQAGQTSDPRDKICGLLPLVKKERFAPIPSDLRRDAMSMVSWMAMDWTKDGERWRRRSYVWVEANGFKKLSSNQCTTASGDSSRIDCLLSNGQEPSYILVYYVLSTRKQLDCRFGALERWGNRANGRMRTRGASQLAG